MSIVGSPGTGKTALIHAIKEDFPDILLHATTNQASELINGITIHKRLGFGVKRVKEYPSRESNGRPFLIDEASMMPIYIFQHILTQTTNKVIFVGDPDQLTVGINVDIKTFPHTELLVNMRAKSEALKAFTTELSTAVKTMTLPDLKRHVGEHLLVVNDFKEFVDMIRNEDSQNSFAVLGYRNRVVDKYKELTGTGITVHKAQGQSYDTVYVDYKDIQTAYTQTKTQWNNPLSMSDYLRLTLVAFSRAKHKIIVFYGDSRIY